MPYMKSSPRVVRVSKELFLRFTKDSLLTFETIAKEYGLKAFEEMKMGSAIMVFGEGQGEFAVTVWVGKNNVSLMINKEEIHSFEALLNLE
mmetsp:Transcript_17005/g.26228  ORF Transcript_17005/g.26228 Transcript_17005/m.26228 type:complete len:91 (-) Transcript_17005:13-285(-)